MPTIERFAKFKPSRVSLTQLIQFGLTPNTAQIYRLSQFLLDEIPIVIAHRVELLRRPPSELTVKAPFLRLADKYEETFHKIVEFKEEAGGLLSPEMKARLLSQSSPAGLYYTTRVDDVELVVLKVKLAVGSKTVRDQETAKTAGAGVETAAQAEREGKSGASPEQKGATQGVKAGGRFEPAPSPLQAFLSLFKRKPLPTLSTAPRKPSSNRPVLLHKDLRETLVASAREYPQEVHDYNALCQEFFSEILTDHSNDLIWLFKEVHQELFRMKLERPKQYARKGQIDHCTRTHEYLDTLHSMRISSRFLVSQHQALYKLSYSKLLRLQFKELQRNGNVGVIATNVCIYDILNDAITSAENTLINWTGHSPPEIILNCDENLRTICVPAHLWHIFFELVKNAMRATIETYNNGVVSTDGSMHAVAGGTMKAAPGVIPPIEITVLDGIEDVLIKVSDLGGGIKSSELSKITSYFYTTVSNIEISQIPVDSITHPNSGNEVFNLKQESQPLEDGKAAPLAGLGYGLPLSKLYAKHFGGDLELVSLWGYGTDAFVRLNKKGGN